MEIEKRWKTENGERRRRERSRDQKLKPKTSDTNQDGEEHECLNWLNSQPSRSVVFLRFGSLGSFSEKQLKETAVGFENSDQRFLWVVRNPSPDKDKDPNFSFGWLSKLLHYFFYRSTTSSKCLPVRFFILF